MGGQWSQFFPPKPHFTEGDLPSLAGRVFLITGGYSGVGLELARNLYRHHGRVYIAGRSETKAREAIDNIIQSATASNGSDSEGNVGSLEFLHLDLSDLQTIKPAVQAFQSKEARLDVLFNNAGVAQPPLGSLSAQGHDLQIATNCLGPFLLTQLLHPLLQTTAREFPESSVRIVWLSSQIVDLVGPKNGFSVQDIKTMDPALGYVISKLGNWYLSSEFARRYENEKIISVAAHPGSGNTNLFRSSWWLPYLARAVMYKAELLANTILFAGLSGEINDSKNGCYVVPWGRINETPRQDLLDAIRPTAEGGLGKAGEFWDHCEEATRDYM
ncbi:short-chain dehydrogenase [Rhypophila sp. PSN 637]